jgi:Uma2 family endonuclease
VSTAAITTPPARMTIAEYLAWADANPHVRCELVDGVVVAMSPERIRHNRVKRVVFQALENAVKSAGLPCEVFTDGVAVRTGERTLREPDASLQCGVAANPDAMVLEAPLVVVEVVSPGSGLMDTGRKLVEYFGLPSIEHYLIIDPEQGALIHHQRAAEAVRTSIHRGGAITLNPPGIVLEIDAVLSAGGGAGQEGGAA